MAGLLALVKFAQEGTLQVQLSCTETLQTFKKPTKSHHGSPVLAENLPRRKSVKTFDLEHDPRPMKYQKLSDTMILDHIYNATTNFCSNSGLDISFRYAYEKADLAAAELDHDYLKKPLVQT